MLKRPKTKSPPANSSIHPTSKPAHGAALLNAEVGEGDSAPKTCTCNLLVHALAVASAVVLFGQSIALAVLHGPPDPTSALDIVSFTADILSLLTWALCVAGSGLAGLPDSSISALVCFFLMETGLMH